MARQWKGKCIQCDARLSYSEQLALRDAAVGRPRPTMCPKCIRLESRGLRATAMPHVLLQGFPTAPGSPLGRLETPEVSHELDDRASGFVREKFGVKDEEIQALYDELLRQDTPVVIAVAPTGSGKSTFVPYRLLVPEGYALETFTAGRQIVITQPRRQATIGITGYVAGTLHGAEVGIGHEVGYRVRGEHACDWRNRLVYVTDGTLINWIVRGELDRISMIVIDEAHERSLNIDVILGLLANSLPQFPHLKVLIVSATIDHEKFRTFFDARLPRSLRCGVVECSGSKPVGLQIHWVDPAQGLLPYATGPLRDLGGEIWKHLSDAIVRLVVEMDSPQQGRQQRLARGDVLGFLHGAKPIQDACDRIRARLDREYPQLGRNTDVYPLYAAVDDETRRKAIDAKEVPSRRRIVIASNAAETSLTIDSLVHVIDSGFIKQTQWDTVLEQAPLVPIAHSQAGCRQRWGRVGRTMEGFAWSLYSKDQFGSIFPRDTVAEIQRSCLDGVVLLAKRGGADGLNGAEFPWLDAPADTEIATTLLRLTRQGALDQDGDLTAAGVDAAFSGGEDALYARLVADADRFGLGIEVATLLPFLKTGLGDLLPDDRDWELGKRQAIRQAQDRLKKACVDDLELCLRVYQDWVSLRALPQGAAWQAPAVPKRLRRHVRGGGNAMAALHQKLAKARTVAEVHQVIHAQAGSSAALKPWIEQVVATLRSEMRREWAQRNGVDASILQEVAELRADTMRQLGAKKKDLEDRDIDFGGLARLRIIISRAFPQHTYLRCNGATDAGQEEARYQPMQPDQPDPPLLGIGSASCCRTRPPTAMVALGPKHQIPSRVGEAGASKVLIAPFVVAIDPAVSQATANLADLGLASYFREHLPRPGIGSEEDRRQQAHAELRRNFPPGTLVECRVQTVLDDDIQIEVLRSIGWGGARIGSVGSGEDRRERDNDRQERDFDFRYGQKSKDSRPIRVQALDEDWADPMEEAVAAGSDWSSREFQEGQRRWKRSQQSKPAAGRLRMVGGQQQPAEGDLVVAEVSHHTDLRALPGLVLIAPPSRERFRMFRQRYQPGDDVQVQVLGPAPAGALVQGVVVREMTTGLETTIAAEDMVVFPEKTLLAAIPIGAVFPARVDAVDLRQESVRLTNLARLEPRMRTLDVKASHRGTVVRVDSDDRKIYVYVLLDAGNVAQGLALPVKVIMYRELFEQQGRLCLPYAAGDAVHVTLQPKENARSRSQVPEMTPKEIALLARDKIGVESGRLCTAISLTFDTRNRLLQALPSPLVQDAIRELFLASNELYGDHFISDLERRFPVGRTVQGNVTWVSGDGIKLALEGGVAGRVALDEITWWEQRPLAKSFATVGDVCKAMVLGVDTSQQTVHLSMRKLMSLANPWDGGITKMYPVGKTVEGVVRNLIPNRAFVALEPGLEGSIHITDMKAFHGRFVNHVTDVVQSGDRVKVRVSEVDLERRQLRLVLVSKLGKDTAKPADVPAAKPDVPEPANWNDPQWPWTEGENAIGERKRPAPPPRPQPPALVPLEKRPSPAAWSLTWR